MRIGWVSVAGGGFVTAVSAAFVVVAYQYKIGTLAHMQAGLFPLILGVTGIVIGAALAVDGLFRGDPADTFEPVGLRALTCTLMAIGSFALLIRTAGLIPAVFVATAIAALGDSRNRLLAAITIAASASILIWLIFFVALGLPMQLVKVPF